jgi:sialidase-1
MAPGGSGTKSILRPAFLVLITVFLLAALIVKPYEGPALREGKDFRRVCRDGGAGGYEAFPDVCRLRDGRLMTVFYAGYAHVSLPNEAHPRGGRIGASFSNDEGRTWGPPVIVYDGPDDDRDPSVVQLRDGQLLCNFFSLRKKEGVRPGDPPYSGLGSWLIESSDTGKSWSPARSISPDYYCSSPVRELPGGRLVLGLYREGPKGAAGAVATSDDGGRSWGPIADIDNGGYRLDAETDIVRLKDGRLFAVEREPETTMCWSESRDGGRTWTVSKPLGFPGHCPYLLRAPGDILLLAHRLPGTSLHFSLDEGRTWSGTVPVDDVIGAYPSMVMLNDGTVLIVYYEEGEGSDIRARRFRATANGIVWLTFD